jgi:Caspase domain
MITNSIFKITQIICRRLSRRSLHAAMLVLTVSLACLPSQAQAPGDLRVALVIGNSAYPGKAVLANPANDASAMSEALRGLGFTVVESRDASRTQMLEAISKVRDALRGKQGVGMLYYAGHGLQLDWRNFMVPVDAKLSQAKDVPEQTVELSLVMDAFKAAGNRMNIVVLDACRDNPFAGTASGKGLAQLDAPPGTFLAYATAPGNVADDGAGQNGLYTGFLLQELKKPQAKIEDVFKRVRLNVRQKSEGKQIPWESTSLEDDFFFNRDDKALKLSPQDDDKLYREELTGWNTLKTGTDANALMEYMKKYPNGRFVQLAQFRLDQLAKPVVTAQARSDDKLANDTLTRRFNVGDIKETRVRSREYFSGGRNADFINRSEIVKIDEQNIHTDVKFDGWGKPTSVRAISDLMGNPIVLPDIKFETPTQFVPAEYKLGLRWRFSVRTNTEIGLTTRDYEAHVAARERVKTALGELDTFRVDIKMQRSDGATEQSKSWVVPAGFGTVKSERRIFNRGSLVYSQDSEIVSFKLGKSS